MLYVLSIVLETARSKYKCAELLTLHVYFMWCYKLVLRISLGENEIKHTTTSTSIEHTEHTRRKLLAEIACSHINSFLISNKKTQF